MYDQPRYKPLGKSDFFADERQARPLVEGTVARGMLRADSKLYAGKDGNTLVADSPARHARLLDRGRQRFDIFCAPCHDRTGAGNGMVVQRGYRPPPSFHIDRLRLQAVGHFFDVITNGFGAMPDYAAQIGPEDRWAIVAYIRALQLSQAAAAPTCRRDARRARPPRRGRRHPRRSPRALRRLPPAPILGGSPEARLRGASTNPSESEAMIERRRRRRELRQAVAAVRRPALVAGAIGLAGCAAGFFLAPDRFFPVVALRLHVLPRAGARLPGRADAPPHHGRRLGDSDPPAARGGDADAAARRAPLPAPPPGTPDPLRVGAARRGGARRHPAAQGGVLERPVLPRRARRLLRRVDGLRLLPEPLVARAGRGAQARPDAPAPAALLRRPRRLRPHDHVLLDRLGDVSRAPLVLDDVRRPLHRGTGARRLRVRHRADGRPRAIPAPLGVRQPRGTSTTSAS